MWYDQVLLPCMSIAQSPGRPVILVPDLCHCVAGEVPCKTDRATRGCSNYRHIRNYYLSNSKTFQDGNANGNLGKINSNDFQDGNWESIEMQG